MPDPASDALVPVYSPTAYADERPRPVYRIRRNSAYPPRISVFWGTGVHLRMTIFNDASSSISNGGASQKEGRGAEVVEFFEEIDEDESKKRKLYYASAPHFALLQSKKFQLLNQPNDESLIIKWWEHVMEFSSNIKQLLDRGKTITSGEEPFDRLFKESGKPDFLKAIWDLVEMFYVNEEARSWLPEQLVDWLWHYDKVLSKTEMTTCSKLQECKQALFREPPDSDPEFWDGVACALAIGWFDIAVKLLRLHGSYTEFHEREIENGLVEAVAVLISEMPRLRPNSPAGGLGQCYNLKADFVKAMEKWRGKVKKLNNSTFLNQCENKDTVKGLQKLMGIMLGDIDTLVSVTCHWIELLVSHFLYVRPLTVGMEGVLNLARQCIRLKPSNNKAMEELIIGIMGCNTEVVLAECFQFSEPWMLVHMMYMLTAKNKQAEAVLHEEKSEIGGLCLEELYLLSYAQELSSHSFTWQIAPIYLASCQKQGLKFLELLLLGQPMVGNDRLTLKVLEVCQLYNLDDTRRRVMRMVGMYNWKHGRKGLGILWLQQAHDQVRLSAIASQITESIGRSDSHSTLEQWECLIDLLGAECDKLGDLAFLHNYKEFKTKLRTVQEISAKESDHQKASTLAREAISSLIELMKNPSLPKRFWPSLLCDSVHLLTWPGYAIVTVPETKFLLSKLQELSLPNDLVEAEVCHNNKSFDMLQKVRLALARNLGRAMLQE